MFKGTIDKRDVSRCIPVETYYLDRLDPSFIPEDKFSLIILKSGSFLAKIQNTDCFFEAPAMICLDEKKRFELQSSNSAEVKLINFDPQFLNINMKITTIRNAEYEHLCQQHAFFQLSPFLSEDIDKIGFRLSADTMEKIDKDFDYLTKNLQDQKDWYWSCRARSYFINIISVLERIFHNYYIEEPYDACLNAAISKEFMMLLEYINNHLEERLTLGLLYERFRINKNQIEELFREFLHTTFYDYLRNRRFELASYYLRFTELDGEQIAGRVGLSSSQNFCKFFRAMSGETPNKFRKEMVSNRKNDAELSELLKKDSISVLGRIQKRSG